MRRSLGRAEQESKCQSRASIHAMTAAKVTFLLSLASWLLSGTMPAQDELQARLAKARATDP